MPTENVLNAVLTALTRCWRHDRRLSSRPEAVVRRGPPCRGHRPVSSRRWRPEPDDPKVLFALGNTAHATGAWPRRPSNSSARCWRWSRTRLEALVNLANLLRGTGQFDAAIALLEPALAREPESPELQLTLGSAWREKGDGAAGTGALPGCALAARPDYAPALGQSGRHAVR